MKPPRQPSTPAATIEGTRAPRAPDALLSENDAKRTPLALIKRYFKSEFPAVPVLTKLTRSYTLYRTRLEVHLLLYRTFITEGTEVKAGCVKVRS